MINDLSHITSFQIPEKHQIPFQNMSKQQVELGISYALRAFLIDHFGTKTSYDETVDCFPLQTWSAKPRKYQCFKDQPTSQYLYLWKPNIIPKSIPKIKFCFPSPSVRIAISPISQSDVVISSRTITDIMNKFIGSPFVVLIGMPSILGLRECEVTLSLWLELCHSVDAVFSQQPSIVIANVGVSPSAIRAVVDYFSLRRNCSVGLHFNKIIQVIRNKGFTPSIHQFAIYFKQK